MRKGIKIFFVFLFIIGACFIINYSLFKPSKINFFIATKLYGSPANSAFTDENFYKCVVDAYNKENNSSLPYTANLSDEQLASIHKLSCSRFDKDSEYKIKNVNGLDKLTSLEQLIVQSNQLTNLDVSNNQSLKEIYVDYNQLTSLDISNNQSLERLGFSSNKLTNLDVSHNPSLEYLDAGNNKLTNLDVSNNLKLNYLYAAQNELTNLNVSNNPLLKELKVNGNELTSIDVSQTPSLEYLGVSYNQLTSIDVSHNPKLNYLYANQNELTNIDVSHNPSLEHLNAGSNKLTNIDVSHNPSLEHLNAGSNKLTSIDVSHNLSLKHLDVGSNKLISLDISHNSSLEYLVITYNQLTNIDVSNNPELNYLYAYKNELTNIDVSHNPKLNHLYANQNKLTNIDVSHNPLLKELDVGGNQLTSIDVSNNTVLTSLDVGDLFHGGNQLTTLDVSHNPSLEILYVYNNQLTSLDVSHNPLLKELDVGGNQLTSIDVSHNPELTSLNISPQYNLIYIYDNDFSSVNDTALLQAVEETDKYADSYITYVNYNHNGNLKSFKLEYIINRVKLLSDQYSISDISNSYIYTKMDNENILNNIKLTDTENFIGIIDNNKYIIKHNDQIIKEFDLINISSSKYDLTKDYIFAIDEDILSNINVLNGDKVINDNKIQIKKGEDILQEFDYVTATSYKYNNLSLDKIKVKDNNIESLISNIDCTNCSIKVKNNDTYKTSGDFTDGDTLVITSNNNILKEYELNYAVSSISLNNNDLTLNLDKKNTFKLEATILPSNAENKNVTWESSNPSVASVDNNGNITAHALGTTTITVKTEEGNFTTTCNVIVDELNTYSVSFQGYQEVYTEEFTEGDEIGFDTNFTRDGYKLIGYIYDEKQYALTETIIVPDHDIELEAIWELVIPDTTNNNKYVIEDNYFKNISLNTDINDLDLGLDSTYTVKITKNNVEKTSGLIGTGDVINIYLGDTLVTNYTVIIKGDVTGSGDVKVADVAKLYQYLKKKIKMDECYVKAGNVVDSDNEIKVADVAKLYQYLKKKIKKL